MRDFSIDLIWTKVQIASTAIGGWIGYFVGGMDGMLIALIVLMSLDYISGIMCAVIDKKLSSAIGFRGICKLYESSYNLNYANSMFMRTKTVRSHIDTGFSPKRIRIKELSQSEDFSHLILIIRPYGFFIRNYIIHLCRQLSHLFKRWGGIMISCCLCSGVSKHS